MARLIDADECYERAWECYLAFYHHVADMSILRDLLNDCPTVDAVPVVRCKDCKHYSKDGIWCDMNSKDRNEWFNWYEDDFCSYGEMRTDGAKMDLEVKDA